MSAADERRVPTKTILRPNPRAVFRKLVEGSGGVVLHLDTAAYFGLNEVGSAVWGCIEVGRTIDEVLDDVRERFDEPPETLRTDVEEFLLALRERDLVRFDRDAPDDA